MLRSYRIRFLENELILLFFLLVFACSNQKNEKVPDLKQSRGELADQSILKSKVLPTDMSSSSSSFKLENRKMLGIVDLLVPPNFKMMGKDMIAIKYPLKKQSNFQVYTDDDAAVNIAFEHLPNKATLEELPEIKKIFDQQFNQPGIDFKNSEVRKINGREFIVIEMVTPALDTEVYNLMFVTSSGGRLLMGTFNCTVDKQKEWQPLAERILNSVQVKD